MVVTGALMVQDGPTRVIKRPRRRGWAMVRLGMAEDLDLRLNTALCGTLPTREQSSPRAELYDFPMLISHTAGDATCYSDDIPLVKSCRQPRAQVLAIRNTADLWVRIWDALGDRGPGRIHILWVRSTRSIVMSIS
eukprot:6277625-Pyramimonas_sp.AAC.1